MLLHTPPRLDTSERPGLARPEKREPGGLQPRMLRRIVEYIDAHLDSELSIAVLADNLGISRSRFSRSFRHSVGLTPHSYVMGRRLLRAQQLLARTDLHLVEIALTTGFADQSHFSRRFHQFMGLPPREFRAQQRYEGTTRTFRQSAHPTIAEGLTVLLSGEPQPAPAT
jgi:transcriptional regulator GlxA family with amidase domain